MSLESLFKDAADELGNREVPFAVAGGLAASLYRMEARLTMDVDLVILTESEGEKTAVEVLEAIGLEVGIARKADLAGGPLFAIRKRNTAPCMVVGRAADKSFEEGVDILLPSMPWAREGVLRAQDNRVDFGFGPVPVLTLEDMIIAKLYALTAGAPRPKDMDDLQSIFAAGHDMDIPYLAGQMKRLGLTVPRTAEPFLPADLVTLARDVKRGLRHRARVPHSVKDDREKE
jgi:hypothetical protein